MASPGLVAAGFMILGVAISYLIGSIPNGVIVGKLYAGVDVRKHGSGNIGTTNTLRLAGWVPGLIVAVLDIAKGALGTLAMMLILYLSSTYVPDSFGDLLEAWSSGYLYDLAMGLAMIFAVVGHMYSPFLKFKGGKGVATSFGSFLVVVPWCALFSLVAFLLLSVITRYVSVGSLSGAVGLLIGICTVYASRTALIPIAVALIILVVYAHRSNIRRLLNGNESKFSVGSKKTAQRAKELEMNPSDDASSNEDKS